MARPIADLNLPHFLKVALSENGYTSIEDLVDVPASDLALELSIGFVQAEDVVRQVASYQAGPSRLPPATQAVVPTSTASALLHAPSKTRFSTLSTSVDNLISHFAPAPRPPHSSEPNLKGKERVRDGNVGAVVPGMVFELSGPPGSGKTSVALGMALSSRLGDGKAEGADDAPEVLIIDTEGSFSADRVRAAAETLAEGSSRSAETLLSGIHLIRIATQIQMIAALSTLDEWLESHPRVRLFILDSLSYHFRQPTFDINMRKRVLELVKQAAGKAATLSACAVVLTSQLATKLLTAENKPANFDTGDRAVLMPQLGDAWTTERTIRLVLFRGAGSDAMRYAHASTASTSSSNPAAGVVVAVPWASFDIDHVGLPCDVPPPPGEDQLASGDVYVEIDEEPDVDLDEDARGDGDVQVS